MLCWSQRSPATWGGKRPPRKSIEERYPVYPIYSVVVVTAVGGDRGRAETVSFVHNRSAIGRLDWCAAALTQSDKEVHGHGDADGDHNAADLLRIDFLHVVRAEPAPDEGTRDHHRALRPHDGASQNEGDYCSGADHGGKQRPDRTHGVNVTHAQRR